MVSPVVVINNPIEPEVRPVGSTVLIIGLIATAVI